MPMSRSLRIPIALALAATEINWTCRARPSPGPHQASTDPNAIQPVTSVAPVADLRAMVAIRRKAVPGDSSARMSAQATRDTGPEVALRSELHSRGLRFRIHRRPVGRLRREADLIFPRERVAVFVDGCFWHGCPKHATWPQRNSEFWRAKIEGNQRRDRETDEMLKQEGWLSVRVWEHEHVREAADRLEVLVRTLRSPPSTDHS